MPTTPPPLATFGSVFVSPMGMCYGGGVITAGITVTVAIPTGRPRI